MSEKKIKCAVVIPALNEAGSIGLVLSHIPERFKELVVVADNGSTDDTIKIAQEHGALITTAATKGYGSACLAGIAFAQAYHPEYFIFLDADYSDTPEDMNLIFDTLVEKNLDLVIGSRTLGKAEAHALLPQARFGNWLATRLLFLRFNYLFSDLGPFRVIRAQSLESMKMLDKNFGWTVEMQIKALKMNLKVGEVSVHYRQRIGKSKITGTVKGTFLAGVKILWTLARYAAL